MSRRLFALWLAVSLVGAIPCAPCACAAHSGQAGNADACPSACRKAQDSHSGCCSKTEKACSCCGRSDCRRGLGICHCNDDSDQPEPAPAQTDSRTTNRDLANLAYSQAPSSLAIPMAGSPTEKVGNLSGWDHLVPLFLASHAIRC